MNRIANGVRNYVRAAAPSNGGNVNPFAQVKNILAKYGTDAHVYLPGIGVINGLTAGNYLDSAGTTLATVDNPVGLVVDSGGINAIQATTANKPILRSASGKYSWQFDGTDSLALGSVPFQMADNHCVIAGASGIASALYPSIFAIRGATTNPTIAGMSLESNTYRLVYRDDAGTLQLLSCGSVSNGELFVATARKVGSTKQGRKNAGAWASNTTALGAATVTQCWIGQGSSASGYWVGNIYPVIVIKGTVTDADLLILEKWVGILSGVTI